MATALKKKSETQAKIDIDLSEKKIAIVVAEWNRDITGALEEGAIDFLLKAGVKKKNIKLRPVPGTFELSLGAQWMAEKKEIDAVICIGCVIRGETAHFDFICQGATYGITEVGLKYNKPVVFGVLTTENQKQAEERAGGKLGNKGEEAAETAIKMLAFKR